jgi:hypothetical protein
MQPAISGSDIMAAAEKFHLPGDENQPQRPVAASGKEQIGMTDTTPPKAIITAAVSGSIHTPGMSPYLPITPRQLIDDILSVHDAGGAVAHLHVRDPQTGRPKADPEIFREVVSDTWP